MSDKFGEELAAVKTKVVHIESSQEELKAAIVGIAQTLEGQHDLNKQLALQNKDIAHVNEKLTTMIGKTIPDINKKLEDNQKENQKEIRENSKKIYTWSGGLVVLASLPGIILFILKVTA